MEACAPCAEVISKGVKACPALLSTDDIEDNPQRDILNCLVGNLENCITEHLHINDAKKSESMTSGDANDNVMKGECLYEETEACPVKSSIESSEECVGSLGSNIMLHLHPIPSDVKEDNTEAIPNTDIQEAVYENGQPDALTLVSAMKGSREKQGLSPEKRTVTWAPDVYDPIPTSVSHSVTRGKNKQKVHNKRHNSKKKNGKNKQKSNASRGSNGGGKDKKQSRNVGNSAYNRITDPSYHYQDFEVGSPSPDYCGSGFLIQSLTKVHYSTAEAL